MTKNSKIPAPSAGADAGSLQEFTARVHDQLFGNIIPFWCGPALDLQHGGWMPWLTNDLQPDFTKPKGLIVNSRILWTFSAVHRNSPQPLYRNMAARAFDFVMNRFWDAEHGGAFWHLDHTGRVTDDSKKIYGQAFYIYALSEYHRAFGEPAALQRAVELFGLLERHAFDPQYGGYWEVRRRDWSEAADTRLSEKDMNEKKSMNNHLHLLEAFTTLYGVWKDPRLALRLRELVQLFDQRILDSRSGHFHHFFDERWRVRSDSYTFGHDIEGSWLLCEAAEALGDAALFERVRALALRMAGVALSEGLAAAAGLCYEGKDGKIVDSGGEWWPQSEAVVGFLNAFQLSGDPRFLHAARRVWDFIESRLVDRAHGEWFWRINPDGRPAADLPKVSEWKGPYHGGRACLEAMRRLGQIKSTPT
jgi:mannobiose 2-epimerase